MRKKEHDKVMKPLCRKLNAIIPIKCEEDKDKLNALIYDMYSQVEGFNLYFNRELYIDCGLDDKKMKEFTLHSGRVHFEPSDDPMEHPGITVRYNDEKQPTKQLTMEENQNYESGIFGKAEVRFGGKIAIHVVDYKGTNTHGIALCEFYKKGTVGEPAPIQQFHDPQVFLVFDNIKSVEMLEDALMSVRESFKRDAEELEAKDKLTSEQEALLGQKITDLDLSVRTLNITKANGIETVRDLVRLKKTDWLKFRNGGKKSLAELDDFIQSIGLQWGMNV